MLGKHWKKPGIRSWNWWGYTVRGPLAYSKDESEITLLVPGYSQTHSFAVRSGCRQVYVQPVGGPAFSHFSRHLGHRADQQHIAVVERAEGLGAGGQVVFKFGMDLRQSLIQSPERHELDFCH